MTQHIRIIILNAIITMICACGLMMPKQAYAQVPPDVTMEKLNPDAHPALRGFAEFGMGTLIGTAAGGTAFLTSLFLKPWDLRPALISGAILYPLGIASGAILGGYLTDSKSGYWEPFVGAFTGAIIADITAYFLSEDYPIMSAVLVLVLPIVTTLVAMEYSHERHAQNERRALHDAVTLRSRTAIMPFSFGFGF